MYLLYTIFIFLTVERVLDKLDLSKIHVFCVARGMGGGMAASTMVILDNETNGAGDAVEASAETQVELTASVSPALEGLS